MRKLIAIAVIALIGPALHAATKKNAEATKALLAAASQGDDDAMRDALKKGADPNVKDDDGNTPLILIAGEMLIGDELEVIGELVAAGAKVDSQNALGMTALMVASRDDRSDSVKALLNSGAKPDTKDADGWSAVMFASYNGNWGPLEALMGAGADVSLTDNEGWTPMMSAISRGQGGIVERLAEAGAKVPSEFQGVSTMHYAIQGGDLKAFRATLAVAPDINAKDSDGWTALIFSTAFNQPQMVMDLLRAGADTSMKDNEGKTALDHAKAAELPELVAILGGDWVKPEMNGQAVTVDCPTLGGKIESRFSIQEGQLVVRTAFTHPLSWYIGGGMTNRADTSKQLTYDGTVAGSIFLDIDNDAKTGAQPDALNPSRKGAEYTLDHSEYMTSVAYHYETSDGEPRQRQVSANVIDLSVYKGEESVEWEGEYPGSFNDGGVLVSHVPMGPLGLEEGRKITVTSDFGKCRSKATSVTLK